MLVSVKVTKEIQPLSLYLAPSVPVGHYISDVYRPGNNLWKSYDDSAITEVCLLFLMGTDFQWGLVLLFLNFAIFIDVRG